MNRCQIVQGTWLSLQNLMNQVYCVAYEQNVIVYIFLLNFVMSFVSGADHQASSAIVSKQTFCVKNLYTITFCSYATNFACFIKFWSAHHVPWTIWHLFLGYRGISIIRGKIVAFSSNAHQFNPPKCNQIVKLIDYFLHYEIMTSIDVSKSNYRYLEQISSNNE